MCVAAAVLLIRACRVLLLQLSLCNILLESLYLLCPVISCVKKRAVKFVNRVGTSVPVWMIEIVAVDLP